MHFIAFYNGKAFLDEAHLLTCAPQLSKRRIQYVFMEAQELLEEDETSSSDKFEKTAKAGEADTDAGAAGAAGAAGDGDVLEASDANAEQAAEKAKTLDTVEGEGEGEGEGGPNSGPAEGEGEEKVKRGAKRGRSQSDATAENKNENKNENEDEDEGGNDVEEEGTEKKEEEQEQEQVKLPRQRCMGPNDKPFPLTDFKVRDIISFLKQEQGNKASQNLKKDLEDGMDLKVKTEEKHVSLVKSKCFEEPEGKLRCCFPECAKLFRGADFLNKHMRNKHSLFGQEERIALCEPLMKKRWTDTELKSRPLPAVEVEIRDGIVPKPMKLLLEELGLIPLKGSNDRNNNKKKENNGKQERNSDRSGGANEDRNNKDRNDRDRNDRDRNDDRRDRGGGRNDRGGDRDRDRDRGGRTLSSYMDIDAPKDSVISADYGVAALPPAKKRRVVKK